MSDQTPQQSNVPTIDFSKVNVIGLSGGGGITSINGDATAAQILAAGGGITITPGPAGTNTIAGITLTNETVVNIADQPLIQLRAFINGALDPGFTIDVPVPNSTEIRFQMLGFQPGNAGMVSDPGAAAATDYLGADNTFRPIPAGGGITSINGDATAAQAITGSNGIGVSNGGGGGHTIFGIQFSAGQEGTVSDPGAAGATDYLGADNTFRPIPSGIAASITQTISIGDVIAGAGVNNFILTAIAPTTGFYQISANIKFAVVPAVDSDVYISIFDSTGAAEIASQWLPILLATFPNVLPIQLNCSTGFQCNAGNTFNINVKITAAAGATTTADILSSLTLLLVG